MKRSDLGVANAYLKGTLIAAISLVGGCRSVAPINGSVQPGSKIVEIRLDSPRTIEARRPDGSRVTLQDLSIARGRAIEVRGDNLVMEIDSWHSAGTSKDYEEQPQVTAAFRTSDAAIHAYGRRISVTKSLLTLGIVVGLVALAIGQASIA